MKVLMSLVMLCSFGALGASGTGGTPSLPCYFDGVALHTTVPITACIKGGGSPYKDGRKIEIIQGKDEVKDTQLVLMGYK
ncbi:hypothetical protein KNT80_gp30 [Vibrio phage 1.245.O._10N.261.54.C7]|uniref:Uncharacterized protein n=1 Tax=Vibrio phage 1.245.O._10N.261.54.C7 TaxID=1881236 RepID=A0A2I7RWB6_9CAUD|nr:hypothetical protein KNT80_gp30 [Vibrio phage 1.245.O._10N.261.54.C7]AUR97943.1 hypothetical protein NVP1245O_30 [Vibrio phage 1.245.O._10N.261.54.C7]